MHGLVAHATSGTEKFPGGIAQQSLPVGAGQVCHRLDQFTSICLPKRERIVRPECDPARAKHLQQKS